MWQLPYPAVFFFFNDTATTEIYTLSLHDALPISLAVDGGFIELSAPPVGDAVSRLVESDEARSEEHTSELQSLTNIVCRLLLEKKKNRHLAPDRISNTRIDIYVQGPLDSARKMHL